MTSDRNYQCSKTLANGNAVLIRAVRPDDRERLLEAFRNLDRETVYSRFFAYKETLTTDDLARIAATDFVRDVMLVATCGEVGDEVIIGSGSFDRIGATGEPAAAEVAFIVEEDYQGLGIASCLLVHLTEIARDHGVTQFVADVLADNRAMLAVFARSGLPIQRRQDGSVVHLELALC